MDLMTPPEVLVAADWFSNLEKWGAGFQARWFFEDDEKHGSKFFVLLRWSKRRAQRPAPKTCAVSEQGLADEKGEHFVGQ